MFWYRRLFKKKKSQAVEYLRLRTTCDLLDKLRHKRCVSIFDNTVVITINNQHYAFIGNDLVTSLQEAVEACHKISS